MEPQDSREEIRKKRRERRKLKKEQEKLLKEDAARKKLHHKESQKIQVLDEKTFAKFKFPVQGTSQLKNKRRRNQGTPAFSLLNYLAQKEKKRRQQKKNFLRTKPVEKKKGKVRKKNVSTLKKLIKRFRSLKVEQVTQSVTVTVSKYVHSNNFRR